MADPVLEQWEAARAIDQHIGYGRRAQQLADAGDALAEAYRAEREAHRSQQRVAIREMARAEKAEAYAEATEDEATKLVEQLRQGNEWLRAALRWYAAEGAWARTPTGGGHYNPAPASLDGGERARGALAEIKKEAGCDPRW